MPCIRQIPERKWGGNLPFPKPSPVKIPECYKLYLEQCDIEPEFTNPIDVCLYFIYINPLYRW